MSAIKMPEHLAKKYRFTRDITGGPVFDFPKQGLKAVDLSQLTEAQAAQLVRRGYTGIALVEEVPTKSIAAQPGQKS